jgi:ABC-type dipeptide/oligopeptide/nickel transport system permease component
VSRYLLRRLALLVPVLFGVSIVAFGLGRLAPGDPARDLLSRTTGRQPTQREVQVERHRLGLDRPLPVQYASWVSGALRGDLGTSYTTGEPVARAIGQTLPATLELAGTAFVLAVVIGIPLGVVAASRSWTWVDHVVRGIALLGASIPAFWLGYLLILALAVSFHMFPAFGMGGVSHLVLPSITLALFDIAMLARLARATILETFGEDYIRTALAKGLGRGRVLIRHALRAALIPLVTYAGLTLGFLFGYSVVVETVFAWPGLGYTTVLAVQSRDYPFIQAFVLLMGTLFVFLNLAADVLYALIDPRLRTPGALFGTSTG